MKIIEHVGYYACDGKRFEFQPGDFRSKVEARILADKHRLALITNKEQN